jgi:uncharacterized RDD family membrane protein YckC
VQVASISQHYLIIPLLIPLMIAPACYIYLYKLIKRENTPSTPPFESLNYKTIWQRIYAVIIDGLLILPLAPLLFWLNYLSKTSAMIDMVPMAIIGYGYIIYCSGRFGQTVGMWVMGIRIVKVDGSPIGWREAWLRNLVDIVLVVLSMISHFIVLRSIPDSAYYGVSWWQQQLNLSVYIPLWYMWLHKVNTIWGVSDILAILLNQKRRALHDFIAGTVVIALPKREQNASAANIAQTQPDQSGPISN